MSDGWQFWIDRGGTFTDVLARDPQGSITAYKLLSENPEQYPDAAIEAIRRALDLSDVESIAQQNIDSVKMGTTVATNALLEHRGEPTLLMTTKGFGDALRIGHQNRPRLFDLHIQLPKPLYDRVVEVSERIDAKGNVLKPIDLEAARVNLQHFYDEGYRAVAIVLMNSYQNYAHELQLAECAKELGFSQVSVSHQVSPLIRYIKRGNTTVVDAYLSPVIRTYVDHVSSIIKETELFFMQSNGGLAEAHSFSGKNSILSGPAAGIVGAIKTAKATGFNKIVSLDMGGTSTDVAHYSGELERTDALQIAGMPLNAPMMKINTIAAGGGSVLSFKQQRFQVGPESAGANPGPACYRRGGPLTVTDCNVMLGRINQEYFPKVFGPKADQSIDVDAVKKQFVILQEQVLHETGEKKSLEEIALGFLMIATHNMANAIKKISVERGHDVTQYALCCFGGAGGQHACAVADSLGIQTILIHPFSGVLSAYGIGLAEVRLLKEKALEQPLMSDLLVELERDFRLLADEGVAEMLEQGVDPSQIHTDKKCRLRYHGTDTQLDIAYQSSLEGMVQAFSALHQQEFGYVMTERSLTVESIVVEVIGQIETHAKLSAMAETRSVPLEALGYSDSYFAESYYKTPLYSRESLCLSDRVKGPAIIVEKNSTTVVEPGWQVLLHPDGTLLLERVEEIPKKVALGTQVDPVRLEVFHRLFMSIAEQMGVVLAKTAYSVNIKERLDFSCAIFDAHANLIANAPHIPVHLGSMSDSVKAIIAKRGDAIQQSDVYMLNDPYNGGTHLPDITLITPVFYEDEERPVFYVAARAHHADIGGITPGSIPAFSHRIEEEGVLIDNFLLVKQGVFQEDALNDLLQSGEYPARNIQQNIADLKAQIAANQKGVNELQKMIDLYGLNVVNAYTQYIQDNAQACVEDVISNLQSGQFQYEMDSGAKVCVDVQCDPENKSARIDFTGTSEQRPDNSNAPKSVANAAVLYVFRTIVDTEIPLNSGCFKPLKVIVPEGCFLNPQYPAAVVAGNVETSQCVVDALYGALNVMAASQGTMNNFTFGNESCQYYETVSGGSGAGPGFNGASAVQTHMTNSLLTDPEILEYRFPVRVEKFSVRDFSGGRGKWVGGDGVIREIKFLEPMQANIVSNHRRVPPYGMEGGGPGATGKNYIKRKDGSIEALEGTDESALSVGDIFVIETPGGGGYGKPE